MLVALRRMYFCPTALDPRADSEPSVTHKTNNNLCSGGNCAIALYSLAREEKRTPTFISQDIYGCPFFPFISQDIYGCPFFRIYGCPFFRTVCAGADRHFVSPACQVDQTVLPEGCLPPPLSIAAPAPLLAATGLSAGAVGGLP